jgi:hypothetical protein
MSLGLSKSPAVEPKQAIAIFYVYKALVFGPVLYVLTTDPAEALSTARVLGYCCDGMKLQTLAVSLLPPFD